MDAFKKIIESLNTSIGGIAVPAAILGVSLFLVGMLLMPIFPDWAAGMKGYFMRALLAVLALGLAPSLIRALYSMGQSTGAYILLPLLTDYALAALDAYDRRVRGLLGRPRPRVPLVQLVRPSEQWGE